MTEKRIQFNNIVNNQLPQYVKEEFPLVAEFLRQYYISQEFKGASADLIQNIDQYLKLDEIKSNSSSTKLSADILFSDEEILVDSTVGFPDRYGLISIDDEIITYTGKTQTSFLGCIRGFSGVKSYSTESSGNELVFSSTESTNHSSGADVLNLSSLFLGEFLQKLKHQLIPGFENRELYNGLDEYLFIKQAKDFYSTRGTDLSFKILFKVLYGEEVKIIKPQDYLIKPSSAIYDSTNKLVVELISGNPFNLVNSTLIQSEYGDFSSASAPITKVERIFSSTDFDKEYYKLSVDSGYNRDISSNGISYGTFNAHQRTKLIGTVIPGSSTLDVDSTVGFPSSGELSVTYSDGSEGIVSYQSKNVNQFFGCQNITKNILDGSDIWINAYASNYDESIKVRITSVLKDVNLVDSYYYKENDTALIKSLGVESNDLVSNNWIFNNAISVKIDSISIISADNYEIITAIEHNFKENDSIEIVYNDGTILESKVIDVTEKDRFIVGEQGAIDVNKAISIKRNLLKVNSTKYSSLTNQVSNIQNIYKKGNRTLIASPSLPNYGKTNIDPYDRSHIIPQGVYSGDTFKIGNHNFYTGDSIYYIPSSLPSLIDEGVYFIARVRDTDGKITNSGKSNSIKLSKSRDALFDAIENDKLYTSFQEKLENSKFVKIEDEINILSGHKIIDYKFYNKEITSQKIFREISQPIDDTTENVTKFGATGILINGVEVTNYKSKDKIYYGSIEKIDVVNSGSQYDVINPPTLIISDTVGTGATGHCNVKGILNEIRIIDPGFDYLEEPKINIIGGNGSGAKVRPSMKLIDHEVFFNSELKSDLVNLSNNTIGFTTYHKFRDAERVIYKNYNQTKIGGLSANSQYYVSVQDFYNVKLHNSESDALSGINTVSLTSYGLGNQSLRAFNKKSVISSIIVEDGGINYENKKRTTTPSGINTSSGYIEIKEHGFKTGEIIQYNNNGVVVGGLSNNSKYYVTRLNENRFKLSSIGIGDVSEDFYFKTNQYIKFTTVGSGTHIFNYPQIGIVIDEKIGIAATNASFGAVLQPIFRGEIQSVYLESGGIGYGSSEILNFERNPIITLNSGADCKLSPVIVNGKIVDVLIINPGNGYNSPPELSIFRNQGQGSGAILTPIIENGQVKSVKIIESGGGYDPNGTTILVTSSGSRAQLKPKLKTWTINLFERYYNNISDDDGIITYNPESNYGLHYGHVYASRKLRESVFSQSSDGEILYGKKDLIKVNGSEVTSQEHSPIIGWAYDGNPIYGPYGYSRKDGQDSTIVRMKSGYEVSLDPSRPNYSSGFFVEDYVYKNKEEDDVLDEHNGRFCVTPDFPNGVYAYFSTISDSTEDSGPFKNYRKPVFPYIIGNKYKSKPNNFNFDRGSNHDDYNLNQSGWLRNTSGLNLLNNDSQYSYIKLPNLLNQTVDVQQVSPGFVEDIILINGGTDYKINDSVKVDNSETGGFGFSARVSRISGKKVDRISTATTSLYNVEFYKSPNSKNLFVAEYNSPHEFNNLDIVSISGLSTSSQAFKLESYVANVSPNTLAISNLSGVGTIGSTGITTYISVFGDLSESKIKENDIYQIGNEKIKILSVDKNSSRVRVLREVLTSVASSHSYGSVLYELPRRFTLTDNSSTGLDSIKKNNREIYFIPKESIGLGTQYGVGIGTTISFSNPGAGITNIFIPTKSIYLPNHNLSTGDVVNYFTNGGTSISVSNDGIDSFTLDNGSNLYVAKISNDLIGVSTEKIGIGSTGIFVGLGTDTTILYFTGIGTNTYHSFKTNYRNITGQVSKNVVTVSTASTHGLINNDYVFVDVNSKKSETYIVKYDDYNRKLLINPKTFLDSDVNSSNNTITINNHGFSTGQRVSFSSTETYGELINNQTYYIVVFDQDNIRLSTSFYNAKTFPPTTIGIASTANGTLSTINPPINAYKNSTLIFDVSDSSLSYTFGAINYPAFDFNFYIDQQFSEIFDSTKSTNIFDVQKFGRVGVDSTAKVYLNINEKTPSEIFYGLQPVYTDGQQPPIEKIEIGSDTLVENNNKIIIGPSKYSGKHRIVSVGSTSFTYNIKEIPESTIYNSTNSSIEYETDSLNVSGSISKIDIKSKGQNYYSIPKVTEVTSTSGNGAIIELSSNSIGKIRKLKINDIGFDFPSDYTLRPNLIFPQILRLDPLYSIESIGITSVGRAYSSPPNLIVFDGKTNQLLPEVKLRYLPRESKVEILSNTYRLNNIKPTIIPIQNSNGVGISSISYNPSNGIVSVELSVGFSTESSFPFSLGDKVLIENISVGVNTTGKGYNSRDYNYQLFTLTGIQTNIGGYGIVSYDLGQYLNGSEFPGTFDLENSSGRIIPEKYFPSFSVELRQNTFFTDEKVKYSNELGEIGYVESWDSKSGQLKVSSRKILEEGRIIEGLSSKTNGRIISKLYFDTFVDVGAYSNTREGWIDEVGFLNKDTQRVQDSFYYQNFSYSLKSRVPYDTWSDPVGSLNHTAGFKKFSDYQLESNQFSGISTDIISTVNSTVDIDGFVNLNCVNDFDLASENALHIGSQFFSDEISFSSRILVDYYESIGNRVLSIDDISSQFNSNARLTRYLDVHKFPLSDARAQKYIVYIKDRKISRSNDRQTNLLTLIHNDSVGYLNQYGRVETVRDLGSFDFRVDGASGILSFYPEKFKVNDYDISLFVCNIKDDFSGVGNTNIGGIVDLQTNTVFTSSTPKTIVSVGYTFSSLKALVEVGTGDGKYQFNEINVVHDRTNVKFIDYGELLTSSGLGTYNAYIDGALLKLDFIPNVGIAATINSICVAMSDQNYSGVGTIAIKNANSSAISTSISSSPTPSETVIAEIEDPYNGAYFLVQVSDTTNNRHQLSEIVLTSNTNNSYITEFSNLETNSGLGTIGSIKTLSGTRLTFTPIPDIDLHVKVYSNSITNFDIVNIETQFNNRTFISDFDIYYGTERDIKRSFELKHNGLPIFQRYFDGSNSSVVSVASSTIRINDHFFVTGEPVKYSTANPLFPELNTEPISIASTDFGVGIGVTDKLPSTVYIIKVDNNNIKLARNAEDALKLIPNPIDITSVGVGSNHSFTSINQNARGLISIDNVIQSPIVSTSTTTLLSSNFEIFEDILYANSSTNLYIGDLIKVNDEIMKIESVGSSGTTRPITVFRGELGTDLENHSVGSTITKIYGNYNIANNTLNFTSPPYGNVPLSSPLNSPGERDWVGISTGSSFNGRIFMRSGIVDSSNAPYYKNYVYDDISTEFSGIGKTFTLKSDKNDVVDVYEENAIILINEIFQGPGSINDYILEENSGSTQIVFTGEENYNKSDINTLNLPSGGSLISIGSTYGFGYQPLVSAGGTAIVSLAGTISTISIGNSGSGYRSSIQTATGVENITVRVGVATSSTETSNIEFIGTATVSNGNIVSIAITNPGIGYTSTNPPYVIIDSPISYSNIPLIYSSSSPSIGIGTEATVDIVIGNGSSVISFELKNIGYGYKPGEILTIPTSGLSGIPTDINTTTEEFQIFIDEVFVDKFSGWSIGELLPLDTPENSFNGVRKTFSLKYNSNIISIYAQKGSPLNIQDNLLVFINDILQVPGEGYIFKGGSKITFTDAPLPDSTCKILFYKGSGDDVDVIYRDIIETIKIGDEVTLVNDKTIGQSIDLLEESRTVNDILAIDAIETNPYYGPGNTQDETLLRPLVWCRQTEDKIINENEVNKDRILYEPLIHPTTNIIQPVGVGSTIIYVENLIPYFNPLNENQVSVDFQKNITFISQDPKVSASATAIVSTAGTITSIDIIDGGFGYTSIPVVSIQNPIGVGTTTSTATATISSGRVTSIQIDEVISGYSSTNPPTVLIEPPIIETESNKVVSYSGDSGVIVGVGTTTLGADNQIIFDLFIPTNSILRETSLVGSAITISSIDVGDFFVVSNSNVGMATSKFGSLGLDDSVIGIATEFSDTVYQVNVAQDLYTNVPGVGNTHVRRVFSKVVGLSTITFDTTDITFDSSLYSFDSLGLSNADLYIGTVTTSHYIGNYSWGKIVLRSRSESREYDYYGEEGISGISSSTIVKRTVPLRYSNYII